MGAILTLAWSPELQASGAEAPAGPNWRLLGLQVLNVGLLLAVLFRFARPPILEFLRERSQGLRRAIESADQQLRKAEDEIAGLRSRLDAFEQEASVILGQSEEQARAERERTLDRAQVSVERIREEAHRVADQEVVRARGELRAEAAELAASIARELLRENLTPEDDERLVREYIDRLGAPG